MGTTAIPTASATRCPIGPLRLDGGRTLPDVVLNVEAYGPPVAEAAAVVLVCPSLTKGAHAAGPAREGAPAGWWDGAIGPGRMFDTDTTLVLCADPLGGGRSTAPRSKDPRTGRPYGARFPVFTVRDVARALRALLGELGIDRLHTAIGGCFGGQQVLELATLAPELVERAVVIATTPATSAHSIATLSVMRHLIRADPHWAGGDYYDGDPPLQGLSDAVVAAMPLWMSRQAMEDRFGRRTVHDERRFTLEPEFEVERFLQRVGLGVRTHLDPNSLLYLTRAVEYFDLAATHGSLAAFARAMTARTLLLSYDGDWRYPPEEVEQLRAALVAEGRDAHHQTLGGRLGHGGFLLDVPRLRPIVDAFRGVGSW